MTEEEEIIQNGLKSHTKTDTFCYIGIGLIAILILIPPSLRIFMPDTKPKEDIQDVVYADLYCSHSYFDNTNGIVTHVVEGSFRDNQVQNLTMTYTYGEKDKINETDPAISELLDLAEAGLGVKKTTNNNTVVFYMDFDKHPEYMKKQEFARYKKSIQGQLTEYKSLQYTCSMETKVVKEDLVKYNEEHNIEDK